MALSQIKNGQAITLSTTEVAYELVGDSRDIETVAFVLVSGTCQATVARLNDPPVIDNTYATWSTAGDKWLLTIDGGVSTIRMRCASAGVVNVNW